jgi:UDP-N-acetylmuramate dehydrogenase
LASSHARKTWCACANEADVAELLADPRWRKRAPKFVLGGGSNIVLTGDVKPLVLKVEINGLQLVEETARAWIVEAGAGEVWHDAGAMDARAGLIRGSKTWR